VPYLIILRELFEYFHFENDKDEKHNLAVLQAAVLLSHHTDSLKKPLYTNSNMEIALTAVADFSVHSALSSIFVYGMGVHLGIGFAIGILANETLKKKFVRNIVKIPQIRSLKNY